MVFFNLSYHSHLILGRCMLNTFFVFDCCCLCFELLSQGGQKSLADKFEYIMHGKLYKISDEPEAKTLDGSSGPGVTVYVHMIFNHSFYVSFFVFLLELL